MSDRVAVRVDKRSVRENKRVGKETNGQASGPIPIKGYFARSCVGKEKQAEIGTSNNTLSHYARPSDHANEIVARANE